VKDISLESSLNNLLFTLIDSEVQFDGECVEGKELEEKYFAGMPKLNKQQHL
jgi:hypothetical protein